MMSKVKVRAHLKKTSGTHWLIKDLLIIKMRRLRGKRIVVERILEIKLSILFHIYFSIIISI